MEPRITGSLAALRDSQPSFIDGRLRMRCSLLAAVGAFVALSSTASATTFTLDSDPFAGSVALTTPGRQIVGGEPSIVFDPSTDVFHLPGDVYGVRPIQFLNGEVSDIPTSGVNTIVFRTFDNDNNVLTPFAAGNAANLIAAQITTPG